MNNIYLLIAVLIILIIILRFAEAKFGSTEEIIKSKYSYKKKEYFMSAPEHKLYDVLVKAVGNDYFIFPQAHLDSIIDYKVVGQNWAAAFKHINQKSVDFVICDKQWISPKLAIELDDKTHERPDRQTRDGIVEEVLKQAQLPLLRLPHQENFNVEEIKQKIQALLK